jgi:hypothetical protein
MRRLSILFTIILGCGLILCAVAVGATMSACGGTGNDSNFGHGGNGGNGGNGGDGGLCFGGGSCNPGGGGDGGGDGAVVCPSGLMCNVSCSAGSSTTITGKVYDPAGKNGLYNVAVYVPATPLQPLPKGVLTGAEACSCSALFPSGAVVSTSTAEDGTFTLPNAPVGTSVPLVLQVGKWRRLYQLNVAACQANAQPDKSLALPSTVPAGDTNDNIPDIAVSTGSADTLECLMLRIGLPAGEYVAGTGTTGHIHVFSGGSNNGPNNSGTPEGQPMPGAPVSSTSLWMSQAQLMPFDIVLLSCEGGETYDANPPALESYLNAGGRVFASHFHYSWFSGPLDTTQPYMAPADWGTNLATWTAGANGGNGPIAGVIDTTLNGSAMMFPKGVALDTWLMDVNALGQNGVPAGDLSIYQPRFNSVVGAANTPSQPWITSSGQGHGGMAGETMYFSFDTPVGAAPSAVCGRAVFSDLHVDGNPNTADTSNNPGGMPPPQGCDDVDLSPQEKALEFMLFDLSSCVIPDNVAPPMGVPPPVQ